MSSWKTASSSTTTPVANKVRKEAKVPVSPCTNTKIVSTTVAIAPANRSRTTIGVGEEVTLEFVHAQEFNDAKANWTTDKGTLRSDGGETGQIANDAHKVKFIAPDRAGTVTITAKRDPCTVKIMFKVIEPTGVKMERVPGTNIWHLNGKPSVGMRLNVYITPVNVSFDRIEICEDDAVAQVTGYLKGTPYDGIHHAGHGAGNWVAIGEVVEGKGSLLGGTDTAQSGSMAFGLPYKDGTFDWAIPWRFRVGSGDSKLFTTVHQKFKIDSTGKATVTKGGASATAALDDPDSVY